MSFKNLLSHLYLFAIAIVATLSSCTEDKTSNDFALFYTGINDIAEGMSAPLSTPSYYGGTPSEFQIVGVKFDGTSFAADAFSINENTGGISITETGGFQIGVYKVSVSCLVDGARRTFVDAFSLTMVDKYPFTLKSDPEVITLPYNNLSIGDGPEVSQITTRGDAVSVTSFSIVQQKDKEYFTITPNGVVSINWSYAGEIPPGDYHLTIGATSKAGKNLYDDVVRFRIVSPPISLSFADVICDAEVGHSTVLEAPALKGYADNTVWSIVDITPATTAKGGDVNQIFKINPSTGAITATDPSGAAAQLTLDESFVFSIKVKNDLGEKTFNNVCTIKAVGFIQPVENFSYAAASKPFASAFTIDKDASFLAANPTFSLKTVPDALLGQISIDNTNGKISVANGNKIPKGTYSVIVTAKNSKGSVDATLVLTIVDNPNYFSYILYGNNIGLTPAKNYANQFRYLSQADMESAPLSATTDAASGVTLEWSRTIKHQMKSSTINASTGDLTLKGYIANAGISGLIMVTATAGKGTEAEYSLTVPVFFNFPNGASDTAPADAQNLMVTFTPFVFQCNPRKGGTAPTTIKITNLDAHEIEYSGPFSIDYRRAFSYFNFNGPDSHMDGALNATNTTFIYYMWNKWYTSHNTAINTGSKDPVAYYPGRPQVMTNQLCYVNNADNFRMVVNPNMWVDDNGVYANGAFIGQMTFVKADNAASSVSNGQRAFPMWIWFDENF